MNTEAKQIIANIRQQLVEVSNKNKVPHLACSLSSVEILYTLYFHIMNIRPEQPDWADRDRFLLGKGHAAAVLYSVLGFRGYFAPEQVMTLGQNGSAFEEHPGKNPPPGVENISGSLGHALGLATGMAKAAKIAGSNAHFYALVGDGELNEGTNWEAAMFAPANGLDNLTVVVDFNKLQGTGRSCEIMQLENMEDKWKAFGWNTSRVDGHNVDALHEVLKADNIVAGKPRAIVADTIKGAGVSFMEDDNNWHYRIPTVEEVDAVAKELGLV
ncbi:transketolase [Paraneptunicella aestuarii]|uniref:transketolase n=1 Tax=Paraneptunicella aestuarii TaxID=2831148 RepID=UPI001E3B068F|nr:transketolase [Paraneptunicella aestuarii]UAA39521.1 transketolase [Paraneptunicella aestuarii]